MCFFRDRSPTPVSTPAPIQPRQPDLIAASRLPRKKELLDPDDIAGVEYGAEGAKKGTMDDTRGAAKRVGTDALKINLNTGTEGGGTGGLNV